MHCGGWWLYRLIRKIAAFGLLLLLAYLAFWPVPIEPRAWQAPQASGYVGDFKTNSRLEQFDALTLGGLTGPEAAVADKLGNVYAATHEGWIVRWLRGQIEAERWVEVGGRPLGVAFDPDGNLWVANAYLGLQRITPLKQLTHELSEFEGQPFAYPDDLVVSPSSKTNSSKIYFSDATTKFAAREWGGTLPASMLEILEHEKHGRIIEYDPLSKTSRSIMGDLSFANGVTISPDGRFLLIAETGEYRVWKHWLSGPNSGNSEIVIDNLPGFPDNIHIGDNGRYWVGLTAPRNALLDSLSARPWLRKVIQRLPEFMRPKVEHYGLVLAIDENGRVLENLQAPSGAVYATTGVLEVDNFLYVTSLTAPFLARYRKSDIEID